MIVQTGGLTRYTFVNKIWATRQAEASQGDVETTEVVEVPSGSAKKCKRTSRPTSDHHVLTEDGKFRRQGITLSKEFNQAAIQAGCNKKLGRCPRDRNALPSPGPTLDLTDAQEEEEEELSDVIDGILETKTLSQGRAASLEIRGKLQIAERQRLFERGIGLLDEICEVYDPRVHLLRFSDGAFEQGYCGVGGKNLSRHGCRKAVCIQQGRGGTTGGSQGVLEITALEQECWALLWTAINRLIERCAARRSQRYQL
eukprot:6457872-Amphidinium_carterae.2